MILLKSKEHKTINNKWIESLQVCYINWFKVLKTALLILKYILELWEVWKGVENEKMMTWAQCTQLSFTEVKVNKA